MANRKPRKSGPAAPASPRPTRAGGGAETGASRIEVTPKASRLVASFFEKRKKSPIRIYLKTGGCGIQSLSVSLEQPAPTDEIFEIDGFRYIVDRELLNQVQPIKVDSDGIVFRLSGRGVYPPDGCGTCGAMGGCR